MLRFFSNSTLQTSFGSHVLPMSKSSKSQASKDKTIRARAPKELADRIHVWAEAQGTNDSEFLREAMEHYLAHLDGGGYRLTRRPPPATTKPKPPAQSELLGHPVAEIEKRPSNSQRSKK